MVGMTEPITVLLVEDDSDLRYLEQQALEMDGYTVLAAHDGPEALRIADQHVGPSSQRAKIIRQPICAPIQLSIGHLLVAKYQRRRLGRSPDLILE